MNPYSVPPLISAIAMLALSLVSLLYERREKINRQQLELRSAIISVFFDYFQHHPEFIRLLH